MNFHRRYNKKAGNKTITVVIGLLIVVGCVALIDRATNGFVYSTIRSTIAPLFSVYQTGESGAVSATGYANTKKALIKENQDLQQMILKMSGLEITNKVLISENNALRRLLGDTDATPPNTALARVLTYNFRPPYGTFIIGIPSTATIRVGDIVRGADGLALGTIDKVDTNTALVQTYAAPGRILAVRIGSESILVEATGRGSGNFLAHVPRGIEIRTGMVVTLPEAYGYPIGEVGEVVVASTDAFQKIFIHIKNNIRDMPFVTVEHATK